MTPTGRWLVGLSLLGVTVWFLAFGLWALAAMSAISLAYHIVILRTGQTQRGIGRPWVARFSEAWANPTSLSVLVAGAFVLLIGFQYGLTIGFWIAVGIFVVLATAWTVRRVRRRGPDGG